MIDLIKYGFDIFMHLDTHLGAIIRDYGLWTHLLLFLIIFCETGLVVTPFLPGDSLLFAAGTFAALGSLNPAVARSRPSLAAVAGDNLNYCDRTHPGAEGLLKQKLPMVQQGIPGPHTPVL